MHFRPHHAADRGARADGLGVLVVWPSDRAHPFYRRAGFAGDSDPLELQL